MVSALAALAGAMLFAACGDDGASASPDAPTTASSSAVGAPGSDEQFVADLCKAANSLTDGLTAVLNDSSVLSDPKKAGDKLSKPAEQFANDFAKATPPDDLKSWHENAAKQATQLVQRLKQGQDVEKVFAGTNGIPELPQSADRLRTIAENNPNCKEAQFFFQTQNGR